MLGISKSKKKTKKTPILRKLHAIVDIIDLAVFELPETAWHVFMLSVFSVYLE